MLYKLQYALKDLGYLYGFDLVVYNQPSLNEVFIAHINRVGIVAFDRHHPERVGTKLN